jgi:hypothetical protein
VTEVLAETPVLPAGVLQSMVVARSQAQERLPKPLAEFDVWRVTFDGQAYQAINVGRLTHVQTHEKLTSGRFKGGKRVTKDSFQAVCASGLEAAEWRTEEIVEAALAYARHAKPRNELLTYLNDALLCVLAAQHGCAVTGVDSEHLSLRNWRSFTTGGK